MTAPAKTPLTRRPVSRRRRVLFILVILTLVLTGQELLFRWMFPLPEVEGYNRIHYSPLGAFDSEFEAAKKRGLSNVLVRWESAPDGFAFDHALNLYGFRGPTFPIDSPADRLRVLFIGDSYVEGCGADEPDTLPVQFNQSAPGVDVINLGVAGANFPEYAPLLRDAVRVLRPGAIYLVACANDLPVKGPERPPAEPAPEFPRIRRWPPRAVSVLLRADEGKGVPRRSFAGPYPFFSAVPSLTNPFSTRTPPEGMDPDVRLAMRQGRANPWNAASGEMYERSLRHDFAAGGSAAPYLARIAEQCRDANCRLAVVYVPYHAAANPDYIAAVNKFGGAGIKPGTQLDRPPYRSHQDHLTRATRELGLPFLDTTDEFIKAEAAGQRLFWAFDGHCNAAGYRLLAEICARDWAARPQR